MYIHASTCFLMFWFAKRFGSGFAACSTLCFKLCLLRIWVFASRGVGRLSSSLHHWGTSACWLHQPRTWDRQSWDIMNFINFIEFTFVGVLHGAVALLRNHCTHFYGEKAKDTWEKNRSNWEGPMWGQLHRDWHATILYCANVALTENWMSDAETAWKSLGSWTHPH